MDVNAKNNAGYTPLYIAAAEGFSKIVSILIQDARVNVTTECCLVCATAFHVALEHQHANVVNEMLMHPKIDINFALSDNVRPIHIAALHSAEVLKLLLMHPEINVNAYTSKQHKSALYIAIQSDNTDAVQLLLSHPLIDPNQKVDKGWSPLMYVVAIGNCGMINLLLNHPKIDVLDIESGYENMPIHVAIIHAKVESVRILLQDDRIKLFLQQKENISDCMKILRDECDKCTHEINVVLMENYNPKFPYHP